uniref:Uncharacterized protein LOC111109632 n=1 Tax=Crassostrea virginica TaxID=6565 RepID=A0A8B8BDR7_CRAVI|nr:uncharacterized protein LOC111109632 [Crassostrea virginica]
MENPKRYEINRKKDNPANTGHKVNTVISSDTNLDTVPLGDSGALHGLSSFKTKENESEMTEPSTTNFEDAMEVDDVDYYDSEDEYWSTQEVDEANEYLNKYVDDTSQSSGRYSKGVEQARNLPVFRRSIHTFASDNNFEVHDVVPDGNCMFRAIADQLMINGFPEHTASSLRRDAITCVGLNTILYQQSLKRKYP